MLITALLSAWKASAATLAAAAGHTVGVEAVGGHFRRGRADIYIMHINDIMYKYLLP